MPVFLSCDASPSATIQSTRPQREVSTEWLLRHKSTNLPLLWGVGDYQVAEVMCLVWQRNWCWIETERHKRWSGLGTTLAYEQKAFILSQCIIATCAFGLRSNVVENIWMEGKMRITYRGKCCRQEYQCHAGNRFHGCTVFPCLGCDRLGFFGNRYTGFTIMLCQHCTDLYDILAAGIST